MLLNLKIYMKDLFVKICKCKFDKNVFFFVNNIFVCRFLCDCAINKNTREVVRVANLQYQKLTNTLIDGGKYDTKDDFTVVRQPFMEHMKVPTTVNINISWKRKPRKFLLFLACWFS
jgi:hypothetical protein